MTRDEPLFGGTEAHTLRSGAILRCGDGPRASLIFDGRPIGTETTYQVDRPIPVQGFGGGELVVSPDERYAALLVYSGQSEQGWELFAIAPDEPHPIRYLSSLPYVHGTGRAPAFSPNSRWLVMAVTTGRQTPDGIDAEDALDGGDGRVLIEWARIYAQQLPDGAITSTAIGSWIHRTASPDDTFEWNLYDSPLVFDGDRVLVELPWKQRIELVLPGGDRVVTIVSEGG